MDEMANPNFLKDTKRLKTLWYSHSTKDTVSLQCWDICKFVAAIERQIRSHLVELSVSTRGPYGPLAPDRASMRDFPCLRQLQIPLDIVMCNIVTAAYRVSTPNEYLVGGPSDYEL